eukprot:jgi/Botrbrau1/6229/Bobra.0109s0024.1
MTLAFTVKGKRELFQGSGVWKGSVSSGPGQGTRRAQESMTSTFTDKGEKGIVPGPGIDDFGFHGKGNYPRAGFGVPSTGEGRRGNLFQSQGTRQRNR